MCHLFLLEGSQLNRILMFCDCLVCIAELCILEILCAAVLVGCDPVLNGGPHVDLYLSV